VTLTLSVLLAATAATSAPAITDIMTPQLVAKLRSVTAADIANDGAKIAFILSVPRKPWEEASGNAWEELHVVDRAGSVRPFITGEVNVSAARFAKDGKSITYLAKRDGEKNASLYRIPVDGGESQKLLSFETSISAYAFSPDETRVAFLAPEPEDAKRKEAKDKGFDAEVYEEQLRYTRVYVAAVGDSAAKPNMLPLDGNASELAWSPTGDLLSLAVAPTPLVDDEYMRKRVRIVDANTGAIVGKVENGGKLGSIRISPDAKHVAFIAGVDRHDPHDGSLFVAPITGGAARELFANAESHVSTFAWHDADTLACLVDTREHTSFEHVDLDGSNHKVILEGGKHALTGLDLAADGAAVTTSETWRHPREVMVIGGDGRPVHLTDHNTWLADLRLAKQEAITYSARDGLQLGGVLVRPLDEQPGRRYPLVLGVHGGPEAHVKDGFVTGYSNPGQMLAARGIAVFYPNYRGSTGRGVKFSMLGQADEAGKEFDDLVDAVDHFVKLGLVDEKKVGITGGSYGGYATAWCSTKHTTRFAAGVMFVGISDLTSKAGTTDIPTEMNLVHSRKEVFEDWNFFLERSPIRWVEQARTPLLIMHGKDDPRVHPSQSLELYRQLKVVGKTPVRLVWYPGEGHGNRKSASRYDYSLRMLQWFAHYLSGPGGAPPAPDVDYGFGPPAPQ
jgi:dipeptidyl aminopeptidase/acylaminoacyl peptidase